MKRFAFLLTVCALLAADNPLEGDKFLQKADEKFDQAATRAQEAYAKAMGEAYETKLKTYRGILAAATKAGDFDRAAAIKGRIEEMEAETADNGFEQHSRKGRQDRDEFDLLRARPIWAQTIELKWGPDHVFVHAPGRLQYRIPTGAKKFTATGAMLSRGDVKFRVNVDGQLVYSSDPVSGDQTAKIEVPLRAGAEVLELVTDPNGSNDFDHAVFVRPRFEK